jgi:hypothetical protein
VWNNQSHHHDATIRKCRDLPLLLKVLIPKAAVLVKDIEDFMTYFECGYQLLHQKGHPEMPNNKLHISAHNISGLCITLKQRTFSILELKGSFGVSKLFKITFPLRNMHFVDSDNSSRYEKTTKVISLTAANMTLNCLRYC